MQNKEVIIHIGYPKAGSTLFQKYLLQYAANKRTDNRVMNRLNLELICELTKNKPSQRVIMNNLSSKKENRRLIISHEHFLISYSTDLELKKRFEKHCSNLGLDFNADCTFEDFFKNLSRYIKNCKIVLIIRKQESIILSEYVHRMRENIIRWNSFSSFSKFVEETFYSKLYDKIIMFLFSLFGQKNVLVLPLEMLIDDYKMAKKQIESFTYCRLPNELNKKENKGIYNLRDIKLMQYQKKKKALEKYWLIKNNRYFNALYYKVTNSRKILSLAKKVFILVYKPKILEFPRNKIKYTILKEISESNKTTSALIGIDLSKYQYS